MYKVFSDTALLMRAPTLPQLQNTQENNNNFSFFPQQVYFIQRQIRQVSQILHVLNSVAEHAAREPSDWYDEWMHTKL